MEVDHEIHKSGAGLFRRPKEGFTIVEGHVEEPDEPTQSFRSRISHRFPGFRMGGLVAAGLAIFVLVVNVTMLIILQTRPTDNNNLADFYHGSCHQVETMQLWAHFAIVRLALLLHSQR